MQGIFSSHMVPTTKPTYSCAQCFERKVKCDRQTPCGACVKHNAGCVYLPRTGRRKRLKVDKQHVFSLAQEGKSLHNGHPHAGTALSSTAQSTPSGDEPGLQNILFRLPSPGSPHSDTEHLSFNKAQLIQAPGRSAFVDNRLWTRVAEELHDRSESLHGSSQDSDEDTSDDDQIFALDCSRRVSYQPQHPPGDVIMELWTFFKRNVDPLLKVVHVPSFEPALAKAARNLGNVPRGFEALMFSIYSISVLSMRDIDCERLLNESREKAHGRFTKSTRLALARAKFMNTTSLVVLQALFLYIFSIRDQVEARLVFTLNGIALRLVEGMGIHRDGTSLGLPPFETEVRRRIWWQIKMHDWKTAELAGLTKFGIVDSHPDMPKPPANINDDEIYPGMTKPPVESGKATDMMFCVLRTEFGSSLTNQAIRMVKRGIFSNNWEDTWSTLSEIDSEKAIQELQEHIETKYIRFCDPTEPLHMLTMMIARSAFDVYRFSTHHPRRWVNERIVPETERKMVWDSSLRLLEKFCIIQSSPQMECFNWHTPYYMHWHPLIHVLDCLRSTPLRSDAEKAWEIVETMYKNNLYLTKDMKKPIHVAVASLALKAYNARHTALTAAGNRSIPVPEFITELRKQREKLQAQKTARVRKQQRAQQQQKETRQTTDSADTEMEYCAPAAGNNVQGANPIVQHEQPVAPVLDDSFWFAQSFGDDQLNPGSATTAFAANFILTPPESAGNSADQELDWAQWDALLSKANFDTSWMQQQF